MPTHHYADFRDSIEKILTIFPKLLEKFHIRESAFLQNKPLDMLTADELEQARQQAQSVHDAVITPARQNSFERYSAILFWCENTSNDNVHLCNFKKERYEDFTLKSFMEERDALLKTYRAELASEQDKLATQFMLEEKHNAEVIENAMPRLTQCQAALKSLKKLVPDNLEHCEADFYQRKVDEMKRVACPEKKGTEAKLVASDPVSVEPFTLPAEPEEISIKLRRCKEWTREMDRVVNAYETMRSNDSWAQRAWRYVASLFPFTQSRQRQDALQRYQTEVRSVETVELRFERAMIWYAQEKEKCIEAKTPLTSRFYKTCIQRLDHKEQQITFEGIPFIVADTRRLLEDDVKQRKDLYKTYTQRFAGQNALLTNVVESTNQIQGVINRFLSILNKIEKSTFGFMHTYQKELSDFCKSIKQIDDAKQEADVELIEVRRILDLFSQHSDTKEYDQWVRELKKYKSIKQKTAIHERIIVITEALKQFPEETSPYFSNLNHAANIVNKLGMDRTETKEFQSVYKATALRVKGVAVNKEKVCAFELKQNLSDEKFLAKLIVWHKAYSHCKAKDKNALSLYSEVESKKLEAIYKEEVKKEYARITLVRFESDGVKLSEIVQEQVLKIRQKKANPLLPFELNEVHVEMLVHVYGNDQEVKNWHHNFKPEVIAKKNGETTSSLGSKAKNYLTSMLGLSPSS